MEKFVLMFLLTMFGVFIGLLTDTLLYYFFSLKIKTGYMLLITLFSILTYDKISKPYKRYLYVGIVAVLVSLIKIIL